jgi:hypothetical protein
MNGKVSEFHFLQTFSTTGIVNDKLFRIRNFKILYWSVGQRESKRHTEQAVFALSIIIRVLSHTYTITFPPMSPPLASICCFIHKAQKYNSIDYLLSLSPVWGCIFFDILQTHYSTNELYLIRVMTDNYSTCSFL